MLSECSKPTNQSVLPTLRRRKHVADTITISSTSSIYLNFISDVNSSNYRLSSRIVENTDLYCGNLNESFSETSYKNLSLECTEDCDDVNEFWNKIFMKSYEADYEVQEVTIFLGFSNNNGYVFSEEEYDSFESDSEKEFSSKINQNDSGVETASIHLPDDLPEEPAGNLTKFAASATKKMQKLKQNFTISRSEFTKSLGRITRRTPLRWATSTENPANFTNPRASKSKSEKSKAPEKEIAVSRTPSSGSSITGRSEIERNEESSSMRRKKNWLNFKKTEMEDINRSVFYLNEIDDRSPKEEYRPFVPLRRKFKSSNIDKSFSKNRTTSWYTESGVFRTSTPQLEYQHATSESWSGPANTCWYTEVGLYDDVTGDESSTSQGLNLKDEPLYQFYNAGIANGADLDDSSDKNIYEEIQFSIGGDSECEEKCSIYSPMSTCTNVSRTIGTNRTLWCELPEVINSSLLTTLSSQEKRLQEAKFEILTSEASYLKSLDILWEHFVLNLDREDLLSTLERRILFGNIPPVRECSRKFLETLESFWQRSGPLLETNELAEILLESVSAFQVYVQYCENQVLLDTTLKNVSATNRQFFETLQNLHTHPVTQSLTLHSFLLLPMQRITRLPLLLSSLLHYCQQQNQILLEDSSSSNENSISDEKTLSLLKSTLNQYTHIAESCNEATRKAERRLEMSKVKQELDIPLCDGLDWWDMSSNCHEDRWLVRSGEVEEVIMGNGRKTGRKYRKRKLVLYLFVDLVVVAKKRSSSETKHTPLHYAPRNFILTTITPPLVGFAPPGQHYFLLTLLENQAGRTIELLVSCKSESDKKRWLVTLDTKPVITMVAVSDIYGSVRNGVEEELVEERSYEWWDRPQVQVVCEYRRQNEEELDLTDGDVIIVEKKLSNGWFYGRKIKDISKTSGWFPGNHTCELPNLHTRAKNLKQRYHLLTYTGLYLQEQK